MGHPALEVADIFRAHGPAWRARTALSKGQLKVMLAIEQCRSAVLGGHVLRSEGCGEVEIAYNYCRNRHCPKCQGNAARRRIATDPKHLGAQIGATLVLHTWGSALTHHPHVHGIVPGGGLAPDGAQWVACREGFFLPVLVLSRLFRLRYLEELNKAHRTGQLRFFGDEAGLADPTAFAAWMKPLHQCEWVVYAKRPFAGPAAVLAYLSRYTHRVAISNQRLVALDERGVTFRWKDYRATGRTRHKTMTLGADEFMRRFLLHVLPGGFHRIRHYGLLANAGRREIWPRRGNCCPCRSRGRAPGPVPGFRTGHTPTCRGCGARR